MSLFFTKLSVAPNTRGFVFRRNVLWKELQPSIEYHFDPLHDLSMYVVPLQEITVSADNQEVLTKDLVAFRFSYSVSFTINDATRFLGTADLTTPKPGSVCNLHYQATGKVHLESQVVLRERIVEFASQEINEKRAELFDGCLPLLAALLEPYGITPTRILLRDITFPKRIQDLFAQELESKIRTKADLENARTSVAAARALKNAAEILKGDPAVHYMQYLETITKIAAAGKHTFVIGEQPQVRADRR